MRTLLLVCLLATGCAATVGTAGAISVPHDSGQQCSAICNGIGMPLQSVVVMANNVGCVCAAAPPAGPPPAAPAPAAAASSAGGMAAIMMQREAEHSHNTKQ